MSELDARIDQALRRRFAPPGDGELEALVRAAVPPQTRRFPTTFLALAAAAVLAAFGWSWLQPPPAADVFVATPLAEEMVAFHRASADAEEVAQGTCSSDGRGDWVSARLGADPDIEIVRFLAAAELGFPISLRVEVDGEPVTVFIAPEELDPEPGVTVEPGLVLLRTAADGFVIYELTSSLNARVGEALRPVEVELDEAKPETLETGAGD